MCHPCPEMIFRSMKNTHCHFLLFRIVYFNGVCMENVLKKCMDGNFFYSILKIGGTEGIFTPIVAFNMSWKYRYVRYTPLKVFTSSLTKKIWIGNIKIHCKFYFDCCTVIVVGKPPFSVFFNHLVQKITK